MEIVFVLFKQIILMFIFMMIGYLLYKKKFITEEGSRQMALLLLYIVLPAMIIKAYLTEFSYERMKSLGISFVIAIFVLLLAILVARLVFGKRKPIEHFSAAFSNAGFIGFPLVSMTLGDDAVFYMSSFVALLTILQWTYGVVVITGKRDAISLKKIRTNPIIIAVIAGIILFLIPVQIPDVVTSAITYLGNMNAPLAMIILGVYLAQTRIRDLFTDRTAYICMAIRLIVIPLLTIALLSLVPHEYLTLKLAILISASAPVGTNVAILAQINNMNYTQTVKDICLSTICCIVTIPLVIGLANYLWV